MTKLSDVCVTAITDCNGCTIIEVSATSELNDSNTSSQLDDCIRYAIEELGVSKQSLIDLINKT